MKILYGFAYLAIERPGREPKIVNANWRPSGDFPFDVDDVAGTLAEKLKRKLERLERLR